MWDWEIMSKILEEIWGKYGKHGKYKIWGNVENYSMEIWGTEGGYGEIGELRGNMDRYMQIWRNMQCAGNTEN
jgi:hypothetical protein